MVIFAFLCLITICYPSSPHFNIKSHLLFFESTITQKMARSSSATFSSLNSFIFTLILLLLLAIIPGGRLAGEVEDKLAKVGQKVDEVGQGVGQVVDQLAKKETSQLWCPVLAVGSRCPAGSILHFYRCCGQLNNECCMKLQTWAFVLLVAIGVILSAIILLALLRCIFCRRK